MGILGFHSAPPRKEIQILSLRKASNSCSRFTDRSSTERFPRVRQAAPGAQGWAGGTVLQAACARPMRALLGAGASTALPWERHRGQESSPLQHPQPLCPLPRSPSWALTRYFFVREGVLCQGCTLCPAQSSPAATPSSPGLPPDKQELPDKQNPLKCS